MLALELAKRAQRRRVALFRECVEIANQLAGSHAEHFPDGIIFVKLAARADHTLVLPTLAEMLGVEISEDGYIKHDGKHRTNVPGVYSAGDVEGGYKQIVTAAGMGSEAAMSIFEDLINPYWLQDRPKSVSA